VGRPVRILSCLLDCLSMRLLGRRCCLSAVSQERAHDGSGVDVDCA